MMLRAPQRTEFFATGPLSPWAYDLAALFTAAYAYAAYAVGVQGLGLTLLRYGQALLLYLIGFAAAHSGPGAAFVLVWLLGQVGPIPGAGAEQVLIAPQARLWLSPESDLDLSTSTDFEDLGALAGDLTELLHQDASLWADACLVGLASAASLALGAVGLAARRLR